MFPFARLHGHLQRRSFEVRSRRWPRRRSAEIPWQQLNNQVPLPGIKRFSSSGGSGYLSAEALRRPMEPHDWTPSPSAAPSHDWKKPPNRGKPSSAPGLSALPDGRGRRTLGERLSEARLAQSIWPGGLPYTWDEPYE